MKLHKLREAVSDLREKIRSGTCRDPAKSSRRLEQLTARIARSLPAFGYQHEAGKTYLVLHRGTVCPFCGEKHTHGEGDGHRVAHCFTEGVIVEAGGVVLRQDDGYIWLS